MTADLNRYEDPWTAEIYDYQTDGIAGDIGFWVELAGRAGGSALELACGTGRVLLPLARAGLRVTGLDISPNMLAVARRKLSTGHPEVAGRVDLVQGDMRRFDIGQTFGLVFVAFRSFQALLTRADQRACLECSARHLKRGGLLALHVFNPRLSRLTAETPVREHREDFEGPDGMHVSWSGETTYDLAEQILRSVWRYERRAADGRITRSEHVLKLHYFFRFEMEWMIEACGFEIEALYGNFDRTPFTTESPEMIFVARRAG
ncbi:MAG: class I SAM-dependent methyltransferase [Armatimonadota bacterium]